MVLRPGTVQGTPGIPGFWGPRLRDGFRVMIHHLLLVMPLLELFISLRNVHGTCFPSPSTLSSVTILPSGPAVYISSPFLLLTAQVTLSPPLAFVAYAEAQVALLLAHILSLPNSALSRVPPTRRAGPAEADRGPKAVSHGGAAVRGSAQREARCGLSAGPSRASLLVVTASIVIAVHLPLGRSLFRNLSPALSP